jgi:hypothetical protein
VQSRAWQCWQACGPAAGRTQRTPPALTDPRVDTFSKLLDWRGY